MILLKHADDLTQFLEHKRQEGTIIGFVPTMGALHEGHLTLLKEAKARKRFTVVSIFVNPTQFNDPADFKKYPITIENDLNLLIEQQADVLFLPTQHEIYPNGLDSQHHYQLGNLEQLLEGKFRPGHFQGVCQVVDRLLSVVGACELFMGRKDYQQCMVIEKLIEHRGLKASLKIVNTVREPDGLAMSSRNQRLNASERAIAPTIFNTLRFVQTHIKAGDQSNLLSQARDTLVKSGFKIDYLELADAKTLEPVHDWNGRQEIVVLVAAFLNEVRLIDNLAV